MPGLFGKRSTPRRPDAAIRRTDGKVEIFENNPGLINFDEHLNSENYGAHYEKGACDDFSAFPISELIDNQSYLIAV